MANKLSENLIKVIEKLVNPKRDTLIWYCTEILVAVGALGTITGTDFNELFKSIHIPFIPGNIIYVIFYAYVGLCTSYKVVNFSKQLIEDMREI